MNEQSSASFLDRTLSNLRNTWRNIAESASGRGDGALRPDLPEDDADELRARMRDCLKAQGGEPSGRARAAAIGRAYLELNETGRQRFLRILADDFATDAGSVDAAVEGLRGAKGSVERGVAEHALATALQAPRVKLLTQFNTLPEGVKFLVDMRADLLAFAKVDAALHGLESDLKGLLASWFDVGFFELRRITWDAPATLLEKLIAYEAVHIFVEVALLSGLADNILALLEETTPVGDPGGADTATFYSISTAQKGLAGISFGNFLIKGVIDMLTDEFKRLKTFATLSPVPEFRTWLDAALAAGDDGLLNPSERKFLDARTNAAEGGDKLKLLLETPDWHRNAAVADALRAPMMRLCACYLVREKRNSGGALDPVAHFHFSNGARIERLNWLADRSPKGIAQSGGIMVNYLYRLSRIEDYHEAYSDAGKVALSPAIKTLLKG